MQASHPLKAKLPVILTVILWATVMYAMCWTWVHGVSMFLRQRDTEFENLAKGFFGSEQPYGLWVVPLVGIVVIFTFLISTRVKIYQKKPLKVATFFITILTMWGLLASYGMSLSKKVLIPFFEEKLAQVMSEMTIDEPANAWQALLFMNIEGFLTLLLTLPVIVLMFFTLFLLSKIVQFEKELIPKFYEYEWKGRWLQRFSSLEKKEEWPDVELGESSKTKEMVVIPGRDRTLNKMIIGSIGTGKTAALALPMLNQDMHHLTKFINEYQSLTEREDFLTEDVGGRYLSGISIIEPSNDLCQKALKLLKAHGIPDEAITYINPLDPNTPAINPLRGPVDKAAEIFAQVINGLNDSPGGGNFFFEQSQRNHLKQYIYLLKLHDPEKEVTFNMLVDMYNNPKIAHEMHLTLKHRIPDNIELIEERDERNYWKIIQGVDEWFDQNLVESRDRNGQLERDALGQVIYIDVKAQYVQGLRNILNDLGTNPLMRRVLFEESDFDFDRHMAVGGVLLVNTAKGDLGDLALVLGKTVLMNLQSATFRRPPMISSFHHILVDEAPDYLYETFREFPSQSRKYKVIITVLAQTIAQLAAQFGDHYMTTLIGTMRNRMVYGDVPAYDAKYFSDMFGEVDVYQEGTTEMSVSPLQEDPQSRSGSSFSKVRENSMTSGDIIFQDAFQCTVKIVSNNQPLPAMQINANFVPKEEFEQANVVVNQEAAVYWLSQRESYNLKTDDIIDQEETLTEVEAIQAAEEIADESEQVAAGAEQERAVITMSAAPLPKVPESTDPHPRDPVNYSVHIPKPTLIHTEDQTKKKRDQEAYVNENDKNSVEDEVKEGSANSKAFKVTTTSNENKEKQERVHESDSKPSTVINIDELSQDYEHKTSEDEDASDFEESKLGELENSFFDQLTEDYNKKSK